MSSVNTHHALSSESQAEWRSATPGPTEAGDGTTLVVDVVENVQEKISPVWPLSDYVAVNPYLGFSGQEFLTARQSLRRVSDLETLMPVDYYREQFSAGLLSRADIDAAVDELVADGIEGAERIDVNQVLALLGQPGPSGPTADSEFTKSSNPDRRLRPLSETLDHATGSHWSRHILEEISKHCATHYDAGQAIWSNPWRELPLYSAWRSASQHDQHFEVLGVAGLRKLVESLPDDPHPALATLLKRLAVPTELWEDLLLCEALTMPGWSAWVKYQCRETEQQGDTSSDFAGLLAMRLCYDVALAEQFGLRVDWDSVGTLHQSLADGSSRRTDEELLRYALLKASEDAFRRQLLDQLEQSATAGQQEKTSSRLLAQMVFCIDVRSERIRRHIEAVSNEIETFGFAGFFGMPIEFVELGETSGRSHVPALISPQFKVHEEVDVEGPDATQAAIKRRSELRLLQKAWKEFQASAASCFAFVETTGLLHCFSLLMRSVGKASAWATPLQVTMGRDRGRLSPSLRDLDKQGVDLSRKAEIAESVLRGIGIVDSFGRLIVLCGHGSQTENNPLKAGLDCGACCGHSGEPNARFAAKLLNNSEVRGLLAERGIPIPLDTHFVAALHNTTTDEIEFFDTHLVPATHQPDLQELRSIVESGSQRNRQERLSLLPGRTTDDLLRRGEDWSEVRPEWGLAGNAAFIAAPRTLTEAVSLDGRSFLHSYDHHSDSGYAVLEQIMTAPLVVANWINMQYYASTVDPVHFGSGNKTVHNVVGRFGVFSGNGGDLMTGLPWQSVHDGQHYQHHPLRLLAVVAAPREAIDDIIGSHDVLRNLLTNGWMHLVAVEDRCFFRYTEQRTWDQLNAATEDPCDVLSEIAN